jgi:RNA polymerase sigma-70 factor (ECF subfamily)
MVEMATDLQQAIHAGPTAGAELLLVMRSREGDRLAFERLVASTARWLFARIYLATGDPHRCEDLVQETFLRAWKKLDSLEDPRTFRGWLAAIAHGVVVDAAKRASRKKRRGLFGRDRSDAQERMLQVPDAAPSPVQRLENAEQQKQMLDVLRSLSREYQDVLSLRYLTGADYETIAKQLAISNGSLRGLLNRGMKMLREKLATKET